MDYLIFLLAILHVHKALCEEIFWDTAVQLSEDMTLECVYPSVSIISQIDWVKVKGTQKEGIAVYSPVYGVEITQAYRSRIYFSNTTKNPSDMSLSFYNASEADIGFYSCMYHTFPNGVWHKKIKVVQSDSFEIATPSNSHIFAEPGQNVTLTYQLQRNWPVEQVTWEKVQLHQIDILASCNLSQGRSYSSKYLRHTWSNCSRGGTKSVLIIPNAVAADSGLYRCYFKASTGEKETFVIRLVITEGQASKQLIFLIVGGIASLLLAVLIITVIILYNRRRRRQARMPVKESRDKQSKVAINYRNPTSTNQSMDEEKEDIYVNYPTFSRRPKPRF